MAYNKRIQFEKPSELLIIFNRFLWVIIGFAIFAILILGYTLFLKPKIDSIQNLRDESSVSEDKEEANQALLDDIKDLQKEYEGIKESRQQDLIRLQKLLPDDPKTAELFIIFNQIANRNNLQLTSLDISHNTNSESDKDKKDLTPEEKAGLESLTTNLSIAAVDQDDPYILFKQFVNDLENSLRLIDIQSIGFDNPLSNSSSELHNFDLTIVTYYLPKS